jgi:DNA polymerase-3 subunit beta
MHVRCGATKSNIKGIDADEFPPIVHHENPDLLIEGGVLRGMINQTAFAAAQEENRPILTGVYTEIDGENITMAAADGYRLAVRTGRLNASYAGEKVSIVVPAKTLREVARSIDESDQEIGIALPQKRDIATFLLPNLHISSQLLDGRFPDFSAIIPKSYVTQTVMYTDDLLRACKRAEIFARDSANSGRLYVKPSNGPSEPGEVLVVGKSAERGDN